VPNILTLSGLSEDDSKLAKNDEVPMRAGQK
jgi:hypothetical protein